MLTQIPASKGLKQYLKQLYEVAITGKNVITAVEPDGLSISEI